MNMRRMLGNISDAGSVVDEYGDKTINEAFYGAKKVERIEKCIVILCNAIDNDPRLNAETHPANIELQKAICDIFGFSKTVIVWTNAYTTIGEMCTAFTIPQFKTANMTNVSRANINSPDGWYVKNGKLKLLVAISIAMHSKGGLTPKELTAVLLHEIGHNFDFTPLTIMYEWFCLALNTIYSPVYGAIFAASRLSPEMYARYMLLSTDTMMKSMPQLNDFFHDIGRYALPLNKVMTMIVQLMMVPHMIHNMAYIILNAPIKVLGNTAMRNGEVFADGFAAQYGYGPYLTSALDKMSSNGILINSDTNNPFVLIAKDITIAQCEFLGVITGGHGSTTQRSYRMLDSLHKDLNNPDIPESMRSELRENYDMMRQVHEDLFALPDDKYSLCRQSVRAMVDMWVTDGRFERDIGRLVTLHYFDPEYTPAWVVITRQEKAKLESFISNINP